MTQSWPQNLSFNSHNVNTYEIKFHFSFLITTGMNGLIFIFVAKTHFKSTKRAIRLCHTVGALNTLTDIMTPWAPDRAKNLISSSSFLFLEYSPVLCFVTAANQHRYFLIKSWNYLSNSPPSTPELENEFQDSQRKYFPHPSTRKLLWFEPHKPPANKFISSLK